MKASWVPVGDHVGDETVAPLGTSRVFVAFVRGSTSVRAVPARIVIDRARLAL